MKICQYCNHKCEDSVSICPSCGSNQFYSEVELQKRQDQLRAEEEKWKVAEDAQKKRTRKLLGALFAIALVVVAGISIISYVKITKPYREAGISRSEAKNYLEAGVTQFNYGNYEAAIEYFLRIPSGSDEFSEAQDLLQNSIDEYRVFVLNTVNEYSGREEYAAALSLLDKAVELIPDDKQLTSTYNTTYRLFEEKTCSDALAEAESYVSSGDYTGAFAALDSAISLVSHAEELISRLNTYKNDYKNLIFEQARSTYHSEGYEAAVSILRQASYVLPDDSEIATIMEEYLRCAPINFMSISSSLLYAGDLHLKNEPQIYDENTMDYFRDVTCGYGSAKFLLDGNYEQLTGTFVYNGDKSSSSSVATNYLTPTLKIYCDDKLVYSAVLSTSNKMMDFSVSIAGARYLTIELEQTYQYYALGIDHFASGIQDFYIYENVMP